MTAPRYIGPRPGAAGLSASQQTQLADYAAASSTMDGGGYDEASLDAEVTAVLADKAAAEAIACPEYASYGALPDPSTGADDDKAETTDTGETHVLLKDGTVGVWLRDKLGKAASGLVVNASGKAYWNGPDATGDVTGRGWQTEITGNGSISKAASGPMVINSGTSGASRLYFTPTSDPTKFAFVITFGTITGSTASHTFVGFSDAAGNELIRLTVTNGSAGTIAWYAGSSPISSQKGAVSSLSDGDSLLIFCDRSSGDGLLWAQKVGTDEFLVAELGDMASTSAISRGQIYCNSTLGTHEVEVDEFYWVNLS